MKNIDPTIAKNIHDLVGAVSQAYVKWIVQRGKKKWTLRFVYVDQKNLPQIGKIVLTKHQTWVNDEIVEAVELPDTLYKMNASRIDLKSKERVLRANLADYITHGVCPDNMTKSRCEFMGAFISDQMEMINGNTTERGYVSNEELNVRIGWRWDEDDYCYYFREDCLDDVY